ncbi:uncharacterized protein PV09_05380 [Verruconis gallopava]|uniref:ABM domain-containing protein n=1 Tax=Verruconis gallopava TaxID=253628 RepID=A0A0D2AA51_9PEZI|nr:uncharacterized protein PV09_05380 [Verruconis gallopava]KIW03628.1 hypothetical protein PV09_05380 [Verruconis gallopava]
MKVPSTNIKLPNQVPKHVQYEFLFLPDPVPTAMITLPVKKSATIEDPKSADGQVWESILKKIEASPGYQRLYWGRWIESENKVQLHVAREKNKQNKDFLKSETWKQILETAQQLAPEGVDVQKDVVVRHAQLNHFSSGSRALGGGAPYTGTAIYFATGRRNWNAVWDLWTTIVPTVPGCMGASGGWITDDVAIPGAPTNMKGGGKWKNCFIAWVGWESIEAHDAFHHTPEFRKRGVILQEANFGYTEYGHVSFTHAREKWELPHAKL